MTETEKLSHTIIIAEVGECFNGELRTARDLIRASAEAGCDIVKFQTLDYEGIADEDPEREWFLRVALRPIQIAQLISWASEFGIDILFTPENIKTAQWLRDLGQNNVKIASSTLTDADLVRYANRHFSTVFVSTGMASLEEVDEAVENLQDVRKLYLMHCISEYPTGPLLERRGLQALDPQDAHLNMIRILMGRYPGLAIGYSDHTDGILAPVVAVAMGARVIEKHITGDRQTPIDLFKDGLDYCGTDHVLSIEPPALAEMVRQIRLVERMLGPEDWERTAGELVLREFLRNRFQRG